MTDHDEIKQAVDKWLYNVVIGLNLCPFAMKPYKNKQIRLAVSESRTENELLEDLYAEFNELSQTDEKELETTLLIVPNMLKDFYDYNDFLAEVDALIKNNDWVGTFQVASFHPNYQFAGTEPEDTENLTNRAPYPVIHLLREASLEKAISRYPNPEQIPENNIETVSKLNSQQLHSLFPYLF